MLTTVIPVFNGERYLLATLHCMAQQTRRPDRLVILDNCSTDRTREIVESFAAWRCEWRQNETNIGLLGNLNRALQLAAETKYLHLLMADDLVKPTFCEKLLAALETAPGSALGYCHHEDIDASGAVTGPEKRRPTGPARVVPKKDFLARQAELATVLLPGVMFKTDFRPPHCEFRDLPQIADCLFLAEWATHCEQIIEVPDYLCQYRLHPFNATGLNIHNLQSWLLDEWRVMQTVLPWIDEPAPRHWLRRQKLKCLFAARSCVKVDMVQASRPEYAQEIRRTLRQKVSPLHAVAGRLAVSLRDFVWRAQGRATRAEQLTKACGLS
ncbi:MAG: glycosyltransferase family 2 protein [Verrucomicrobia bacterium]|nr:glycosyltransferase family 2 protein [Verrucomicrobiota bacterium]